ncbi:E8 early protein [Bos taurus papillomavirus 38]|nr:E8 early protein [Bos taurus papillomavirus 38]
MSLVCLYFLLLFWCGFNVLTLIFGILIILMLMSAVDRLNGWD